MAASTAGAGRTRGVGFAGAANAGNISAAVSNTEKTGELSAGGYYGQGWNAAASELGTTGAGLSAATKANDSQLQTGAGGQVINQQVAQNASLGADLGENYVNSKAYAPSLWDKVGGDIALAAGVVSGGIAAAPLAGAAGVAAAGAGSGAVAGAGFAGGATGLGIAGGAAAGAVTGGITGLASSALTGQNIGKGVLTGALLGGVGGGLNGALSGDGLSSGANSLISKTGTSLVGSALSGQNGNNGNNGGATQAGVNYFGGGAIQTGVNYLGGGAPNGGQGNYGNMASSTDTSLAGTIGSSLGGLLQAGAGTAGALAAANAQSNADQNAITTQQGNLANINNIWSTQQQTGQGANTALQSSLGLNGQPANYSNFENMPGYQFAVSQGTQAIQRQAAAMGNAYTPNTAAAVGQYVTGTASQDYNTYISQLMGAAGLGTQANQGLQTGSQQSSNNISQLQQNIGQAQARGYTGVADAAGGLFSPNGAGTNLLGAAGNYLGGGGGSGGGVGGSASAGGAYADNPTTGTGAGDTYNPGSNYTYDANGNIIGQGAVTPDSSGVFGTGAGSSSDSWLSGYGDAGSDLTSGGSDILDSGFDF